MRGEVLRGLGLARYRMQGRLGNWCGAVCEEQKVDIGSANGIMKEKLEKEVPHGMYRKALR